MTCPSILVSGSASRETHSDLSPIHSPPQKPGYLFIVLLWPYHFLPETFHWFRTALGIKTIQYLRFKFLDVDSNDCLTTSVPSPHSRDLTITQNCYSLKIKNSNFPHSDHSCLHIYRHYHSASTRPPGPQSLPFSPSVKLIMALNTIYFI